MSTDEPTPRLTATADLSRRVERLESEVSDLKSTVGRIEINQAHAEELSKLRHTALETGLAGLTSTVGSFMTRVEGIITGEVQTSQTRRGAELVAEYERWRDSVDTRLDGFEAFVTQGRLLARLAVLLIGGNVLGICLAVISLVGG